MEQAEKETSAQGKKKKARSGKAKSPPKRRRSKVKLVKQVIESLERKLESTDLKPSVGDFIRLLQLEKELEQEQPREIKVSWVEPGEEQHAGEE